LWLIVASCKLDSCKLGEESLLGDNLKFVGFRVANFVLVVVFVSLIVASLEEKRLRVGRLQFQCTIVVARVSVSFNCT
jgi:hypothetical protein